MITLSGPRWLPQAAGVLRTQYRKLHGRPVAEVARMIGVEERHPTDSASNETVEAFREGDHYVLRCPETNGDGVHDVAVFRELAHCLLWAKDIRSGVGVEGLECEALCTNFAKAMANAAKGHNLVNGHSASFFLEGIEQSRTPKKGRSLRIYIDRLRKRIINGR